MKVLTIDIGGTMIKYALMVEGKMVWRKEYPNDLAQGGRVMMAQLVDRIKVERLDLDAIGLAVATQVNSQAGSVRFSHDKIPDFTGFPIKDYLEDQLKAPCFIENDSRAAGLGELYFGSQSHTKTDFVMVTYGTGIGGTAMINGRPYRGAHEGAGEFGHMVTHAGGRLCKCGQRGCYERYASTSALVGQAQEIDPSLHNGRKIMAALKQEDCPPELETLYQNWVFEIVQGLVSINMALQPPAFVLGGGIMEIPSLLDDVRTRFRDHSIVSHQDTPLVGAQLGNAASLYGMLALVQGRVK